MPYVRVETNAPLDAGARDELAGRLSALAARLTGKPERWVMVRVEAGAALLYGGSDEAAAFVEFKSIGLDATDCPTFSAALCGLLREDAGVPPERVYIEFKELPRAMFGWNGATF